MQLIEVNNNNTRKAFLDVARIIYKDDPVWVCPLDIEIDNIFGPRVSPTKYIKEPSNIL